MSAAVAIVLTMAASGLGHGPILILTEDISLHSLEMGAHPQLAALVEESHVALVNCRTRSDSYSAKRIHREAFILAAGSGRRLRAGSFFVPGYSDGVLTYDGLADGEPYGVLADVLEGDGYRVLAETASDEPVELASPNAGLLAMGSDLTADTEPSVEGPSFTVLSAPADIVDDAIAMAREAGTPVFLLTMPPRGETWSKQRLALFLRHGGGPGLLASPTTRRPGLIRVTDVMPAVLDGLGLDAPLDVEGRASRLHPAPAGGVLPALVELQDRGLRAELGRRAAFRVLMSLAILIACLALLARPASDGSWPRRLMRGAALGILLVPAALAVAPLLTHSTDSWAVVYRSVCVAVCVGILMAWLASGRLALILALGGAPLVVIVDQLMGGQAAAFSYLGYSLQRDSRLYGIGNSLSVITIVSSLLLVGALAEAFPKRKRAWCLLMLAPLAAIGAPQLGANTGGLLTATFALLLALGLSCSSRRAMWALFLSAPIGAAAAVAAAGLYDVYAHGDPTTHLGHATKDLLNGEADWLRRTLSGKVSLVKRGLSVRQWWGGVGAATFFLPFVWADAPRPTSWAPPMRYVLAGAVTAVFAGFVNDSGIVMTTMGSLPCIAAGALLHQGTESRG